MFVFLWQVMVQSTIYYFADNLYSLMQNDKVVNLKIGCNVLKVLICKRFCAQICIQHICLYLLNNHNND